MEDRVSELPAAMAEVLHLGLVMGQNQTFAVLAGRCSAAQAAALRRLREEGLYKSVNPQWGDFCSRYLKMSKAQANRIIQCLEQFGAGYFELAQLTRVSPETYRAIAPSIQDGVLHSDGEEIELNVDNSRKVAAAVADLRRALPKKQPRPLEMHERVAELDKRCTAIISEFEEISRKERQGENWLQFTAALTRVATALRRIEQENGIA
jgi:hypothetical protein